ncbi:3'-5' exonuclease [Agromyces sp. MMS24-JH15]|uniref:3'-5' exonuclease n=1 Tax=Agromyces sp. MMS24-JH15 TaxID=3243765 RepID=UPI00374A7D76
MPNVVLTNIDAPDLDKMVEAKIFSFLKKLRADDSTPGLHIEKMNNPADPRARTGRVDLSWRAVLYRIETSDNERTYVYAGTYKHDKANDYARTRVLKYNPINGVAELIQASTPSEPSGAAAAEWASTAEQTGAKVESYLESHFNYALKDLTDMLGFDEASACSLLSARDETEVIAVGEGFANAWQQLAALGLAMGDSLDKIKGDLGLDEPVVELDTETEDDRLARALAHPAAKMQFTFVGDDEELERIIEGGDFDAWRVFLHPEQQRYATGHWNGPFRLTGGAGTGKTVVLLHRARQLALAAPTSSIVLTTYTRALAENLQRDLEHLDPHLPKATKLGGSGVLVRGIDQLSTSIRYQAGSGFGSAAVAVLGEAIAAVSNVTGNDAGWAGAITAAAPALPDALRNPTFFEGEYLQVILPGRITEQDEYFSIRRPGRGVALDRQKRAEVWRVVEEYRQTARAAGTISWAEQAAIGAVWLDLAGAAAGLRADHLLVDEGQDLTPSHWQFLRALVKPGTDDLFLAEDTHQRIYGQHVVLARYGIRIVGRSKRLTLNYRTTEQNLRYALGVLSAGEYLDADNETETTAGYRSARRGPEPAGFGASDDDAQIAHIAELIGGWLEEGVDPGTIAVLARTNDRALVVRDGLNSHGIASNHIKSAQIDGDKPVALTMHTAKGMEFSRVVLFDISEGSIPNPQVLHKAAPEEHADVLLRERSLLYVAASRARDVLTVTWKGDPSQLLN